MTPATWIGALGIAEPTAIWHSPIPLTPAIPLLTSFPRALNVDVRETTISGDAPSNEAVLVSDRAHRYSPFEVVRGRVDGQDIEPAYVDSTAVIFLAPQGTGGKSTVHWDIDVRAVPDYVDVLTFASR